MIKETIIFSSTFITTGSIIYDAIHNTTKTNDIYKKIYSGITTPLKDIWGAGGIVIDDLWKGTTTKTSEVYNASPSKEAIGTFISDSTQSVWNALTSVVNDLWNGTTTKISEVYKASPSTKRIGEIISDSAQSVWNASTSVVNDVYKALKTPLIDFTESLPNLFGATGASIVFAASYYAIGLSYLVIVPLSIGIFTFVKGLTEYNGVRSSELKYQDSEITKLSSDFNDKIFNQFTLDKKSIYEDYKNEAFSFNKSHIDAMTSKKDTLLKYLDEIEDYINDFSNQDKDFCTSNGKSSYFTVLHYVRNINNLKVKQDILSSDDKDTNGGKWYIKYFDTKNSKQINDTFKTICEMRQEISEFKEKNDIEENDYKEFCVDNANEPLCSIFVKDVLFPELVDA